MEHRSKSVIDLESIVVYVGTTEGIIVDIRVISLHRCPSDRGIRKVWLQRAKLVKWNSYEYILNIHTCALHILSVEVVHQNQTIFYRQYFRTRCLKPICFLQCN